MEQSETRACEIAFSIAPACGTQLITEVAAQQTTILENQSQIDEKLAAIGEDVRVARIFVGRGGGKAK